MRIDFRFVGIEYELWALGRMLDVIEPTIARLASQDEHKTLEELEEGGWSPPTRTCRCGSSSVDIGPPCDSRCKLARVFPNWRHRSGARL